MRVAISTLAVLAMLAAMPSSSLSAQTPAATADDPYVWLEDKDGAKAMAWVEAENARTLPRLQSDPRYETFHKEALAIATATDRIPNPDFRNGRVLNLWRDAEHPHGIWRFTTTADYRSPAPRWTTLID